MVRFKVRIAPEARCREGSQATWRREMAYHDSIKGSLFRVRMVTECHRTGDEGIMGGFPDTIGMISNSVDPESIDSVPEPDWHPRT